MKSNINQLHRIYNDFDTPIEGLQRINAMLEFLVSIESSPISKDLTSTSREGIIVIIGIMRKTLDIIAESV